MRASENDGIIIEQARASDLARIAALANRAAEVGSANFATEPEPVGEWQQAWERTAATHPWLVARARIRPASSSMPPSWAAPNRTGEVVGFAKASPHRARGAYRWTAELSIYIDERWQGRGIGTALYRVLIPLLRAQGYVTLLAGITAGHTASEHLHAAAGFIRCGTFHRAGWKLATWHDVGYWELDLQPAGAAPGAIRGVQEIWWSQEHRPAEDRSGS
jgi:phosphinothricin acetyltransferase